MDCFRSFGRCKIMAMKWVQSEWSIRGVDETGDMKGSIATCERRSDAALIVEMHAALVALGAERKRTGLSTDSLNAVAQLADRLFSMTKDGSCG